MNIQGMIFDSEINKWSINNSEFDTIIQGRKNVIVVVEDENADEEKALEACMEAGANDVSFEEDGILEFETDPSQVGNVANALREMGYNVTSAEVSQVPNNYTKVEDEEALKKLALFFDALDEDDDVQNVWNNLENTEDLPEL